MFPFFYFDWSYFALILPAMLFTIIAGVKVNSTFKKYANIRSKRGFTGAQAARRVLDANGLYHVQIQRIRGNLNDHFDPRTNVIRLSDATYDNTSPAAIGVAAHEAGHAVQHAVGYAPLKFRAAIIPATNFGSKLSWPMIALGIILSYFAQQYIFLAYVGVILFALSTLFQLVTLPTEFNASRRAMEAVASCGLLDTEEMQQTRKVLSAAAMTYVAALAYSLANLLRLLMIVQRNDRR